MLKPWRETAAVLAGLAIVCGLAGCGGGETEGPAPTGPAAQPPAASTVKKEKAEAAEAAKTEAEAPAEGWGTLTGRFVLTGEIPDLPPLVRKGQADVRDHETCAAQEVPNETLVVDPDSRGIQNIFVYLRSKPDRIHPDLSKPAEKEVVFDQKECRFLNRALALRVEQTLLLANSDPIAHNTNIHGGPAIAVNPLLPPEGDPVSCALNRASRYPVLVDCNIHTWMKAFILPLDHPYFAVTNEKGEFTIEKLPAGEIEVRIWQENVGNVTSAEHNIDNGARKVTIQPDQTTELNIELDAAALGF